MYEKNVKMNGIKILNLCAKHPVFDGRVYDKISLTLRDRDYEVHNTSPNAETFVSKDNIHIHGFKQEKGFIKRILSLKLLYKLCFDISPDFIFAHEPDALFIGFIYYIRNKKKSQLYFDCHEAYEIYYNEKTPFKLLDSILNGLLMRVIDFIVKRIDGVTSVNNTMTERYSKINTNSFMLPSITSSRYSISGFEPYQKLNSSVYFGQYGNSKQKEMFLKAASILKSKGIKHKITIIGGEDVNGSTDQSFETYVNKKNLSSYFEFYGWLDKEEAFKYIRQYPVGIMRFDSYTMPGNFAMPNKIFEYMSNGLAILGCEKNIEIAKIINMEKCGILIPEETGECLAEAIIYINEHPDDILEMRKNAFSASQTKYNWNFYGDLLETIISKNK